MTMNRIKYECSLCGWSASVPSEWADVKPTYCGNSKCSHSKTRAPKTKKNFVLDPKALKVQRPNSESVVEKKVVKKRKYKEKSENAQQ